MGEGGSRRYCDPDCRGSTLVVRHRGLLAALTIAALLICYGNPAPVAAPGGERSLTIYSIHTKETVTAVYKRHGKFVEDGVAKLNHAMRDHRRDESTQMDPALFDLLWQVHTELGSKEPIHLISGYRSRATNNMLRRTAGGQASESRHILGKAADVHFPDVPVKLLRYSALIQERGGVGYYPTSALPFVHLDTDRVRSWPRLPRHELALLFPSGTTRHAAADGGSITKDDVRAAQARHGELAQQVAMFHQQRATGTPRFAVADAGKSPAPGRIAALPSGLEPAAPTLVERPQLLSRLTPAVAPTNLRHSIVPSASDRARLAELASLASAMPQLVVGPAPARRPERASLPSLTGSSLPVPPDAIAADKANPEGRQVASLGLTALPEAPMSDAERTGWGGWSTAPAYDEEHPEELSYRPFPITPYLTETASQPLMSELIAHDLARTLDMLDQPELGAMLRFRPTMMAAKSLWAQQFSGSAVNVDPMRAAAPAPGEFQLAPRQVKTSQR